MRGYLFAGLAVLVVVVAVIGGLIVIGSPATERERQMDIKRVQELGEIGRAADLYRTRHGVLPSDLGELARESGPTLIVNDPATRKAYEYRVLDPGRYELCAEFQGDSGASERDFWFHRAGRQCFRLDAREVRR